MAKGFIQLDREVFESGIFKNKEPFSKREAWIDILVMVNYKDSKILVGNTLIECKAGQSILSQESWAKRWNWDRSMVRRYFELLQKSNMITIENVQKTTRITVLSCTEIAQELHQTCTEIAQKPTMITPLKSNSYEQVQPNSDPILTNERPFVDPILTTIEEGNKEIKKESNTSSSSLPPEEKKVEGFNLAGKEREEKGLTQHEMSKLTVEQTQGRLLQDNGLFELFARATKLERKNFEKAIEMFIQHSIKKIEYPRVYDKGDDQSKKHFKNWYVLIDFKEFQIQQIAPIKKKVSEMNPEEFKAFSEEEKLQEKRDFEQNARERDRLADLAEAKRKREADFLTKKPPAIYSWMQTT